MTRVLYAGLDVSLEMTSICVVDAEGGMILEAKAVSDPVDIGDVLAGIDGTFERVVSKPGLCRSGSTMASRARACPPSALKRDMPRLRWWP